MLLADALAVGSSGAIERSEKRGQQELVESSQLPVDRFDSPYNNSKHTVREMLLANGGKVLHETADDPIFYDVILPKGWGLKPTDHDMWSDLIDASGRTRAAIFYKAAFYDRSAHIDLVRRFSASAHCLDYNANPKVYVPAICDSNDNVVWHGARVVGAEYDEHVKLREEAEAVLKVACPDYMDPSKYWDVEPTFPPSVSPLSGLA
jgi:hypothetical protein